LADSTSHQAVKSRVMVVEDDRASRSAMVALLRITGFEPVAASTVAEAMTLLEQTPACMILDLMLPDGNGSSVLAHVRNKKMPICVVVTTGAMDFQRMLAASPEPPDAVFSKPVDFKRLTDWLHAHCQQTDHLVALGAPPPVPTPKHPS